MYARCTVTHAPTDTETVEQGIKVVQDQIMPIAREMDGFEGLLTFVDRDSGKTLTFTLWATEEARAASAERAKAMRADVVEQTGEDIVAVEHYELVIDER